MAPTETARARKRARSRHMSRDSFVQSTLSRGGSTERGGHACGLTSRPRSSGWPQGTQLLVDGPDGRAHLQYFKQWSAVCTVQCH